LNHGFESLYINEFKKIYLRKIEDLTIIHVHKFQTILIYTPNVQSKVYKHVSTLLTNFQRNALDLLAALIMTHQNQYSLTSFPIEGIDQDSRGG
jgi:hypothetical protein